MKPKIAYPLRVIHFVGSLKVGGAEKVVSTLVKYANHNQDIVSVLAFNTGPLACEIREAGVEIILRPIRWALLPFWLISVVRDLRKRRIDVLHTHLFTADVLGRIVGWMASVPVIVSTLHAPSTWKKSRKIKDLIKKNIDRYTANLLTQGLVAISDEVKRYQVAAGKINPSKIRVIGNPICVNDYHMDNGIRSKVKKTLDFSEEDIVITNVASLKPIKGQEYLLRSIARLLRKHPNVRLMLVGDGDSRSALKAITEELGINQKVKFMGLRDDVPHLLSATDIFVITSLSEGISIAALEAMGARLPVVATAVGGNVDLIKQGKTGLLVKSQDEEELAYALESLILNPIRAKRMGDKAFEFVKTRYDARLIAQQIDSYYRELNQKTNN